jgi:hypothetical protein
MAYPAGFIRGYFPQRQRIFARLDAEEGHPFPLEMPVMPVIHAQANV